jgi:putative mRNA 3-end processing factor
MEHEGRIWVASGDYKLEPTAPAPRSSRCAATPSSPNPPSACRSTAGSRNGHLRRDQPWWRDNAAEGRASVLFCYSFGKAQRILHGIDASIGPIVCHGAVEPLNRLYREAGIRLPTPSPSAKPRPANAARRLPTRAVW